MEKFLLVDRHYSDTMATSSQSDIIKECELIDLRNKENRKRKINNYDFKMTNNKIWGIDFFNCYMNKIFIDNIKLLYNEESKETRKRTKLNEYIKNEFITIIKTLKESKTEYKGLKFEELEIGGSYWTIKINIDEFYNLLLTDDKKYNNTFLKKDLIFNLLNITKESLYIRADWGEEVEQYIINPFSLSIEEKKEIKNSKGLTITQPTVLKINIHPVFFECFTKFNKGYYEILPNRETTIFIRDYKKENNIKKLNITIREFYKYYTYFLIHNNNKSDYITFNFLDFAKEHGREYFKSITNYKTINREKIKSELLTFLDICKNIEHKGEQLFKDFTLKDITKENKKELKIEVLRNKKTIINKK